jgi:heme/copper-type cytochrome/quinol oxidase subunit 3
VLNGIYKEYQYDDLKLTTKQNLVKSKAHTVAGTIEPYKIKDLTKKKSTIKSPKSTKNAKSQAQTAIDSNIKTKIHYLIACDFCIFIGILSIFMGDLVNVLNDSQSLQMDLNSNLFLLIHKYSFLILSFIISLSIVLLLQRPKVARIFNILLISGCTWVHNESYEANNAEKRYIIQLLSSFFLSLFIFIARLYNIIQAVSYL